MSLLGASSLSRTWISPTVSEEGEDEEDEIEWLSCFMDVREVDEDAEEELVKPGTTIGTKFSVLQIIRIPFPWDVVFDHWSIRRNTRFHRKTFQSTILLACFRILPVKNIPNSFTYTIASSCVCTSPLAVMTIAGPHDFVKVSISALLRSFLLIMCIDAPESTTNSRSSSLRFDANKHQFSEGEKNVALSRSIKLKNTIETASNAASRAPCSCHSVSSRDRSSKFGGLGLRWWGSPGQIIPSEGFVSNVRVMCNGFREFYTSDRFPYVRALPQNRWRLRRLHILKICNPLVV